MALQLLNTVDTVSRLHSIIRDAKKEVFLVSPYIKLGVHDRIYQSMQVAIGKKVRVTVVQRITDTGELENPDDETQELFSRLERNGFHWRFVPWLHAKLYWSESAVLVTSLNLLATSIANSIEVGHYSEAPEDVAQARQYFEKEIAPFARSIETRFKTSWTAKSESSGKEKARKSEPGHCIRCSTSIPLNPEKPYCTDDYESWAEYENEDYVDKFCHRCGEKHKATMRKPLCRSCYDAIA